MSEIQPAPTEAIEHTVVTIHRGLLQAALLPMEVPGVETLRTGSAAQWDLKMDDFRMRISRESSFNTLFTLSDLKTSLFRVTLACGAGVTRFNAEPKEDGAVLLRPADDIPSKMHPNDIDKGRQLLQTIMEGATPDHVVQNTHHSICFRDLQTASTISAWDEILVTNDMPPTTSSVLEVDPGGTGPFKLHAKLADTTLEYSYFKCSDEKDTVPSGTLTNSRLDEVRTFGARLLRQLQGYNAAYRQLFNR